MSPLALSDAKLYEALAERKAWALSTLYDRYATVLYSLAYNILQRDSTAQEIVEQTFVMLWHKSAALQQAVRDHVGSWLLLFCRNLAITYYRFQNQLAEMPSRAEELEQWCTAFVANTSDPLPLAENKERLRAVLECLPKPQRAIVDMIFLRGMTTTEIAGKTHLTESEVRTQMHIALMKMKDQVEAVTS